MKYLLAFTPIYASLVISSCGQGSAASLPASSGADAIFSYTLQGKSISGGPTDVTQTSNVAHIEKSEKGTMIQFFLNDAYDEKASAFPHSLRFAVPSTTGTTQLTAGSDNGHVELFVAKVRMVPMASMETRPLPSPSVLFPLRVYPAPFQVR